MKTRTIMAMTGLTVVGSFLCIPEAVSQTVLTTNDGVVRDSLCVGADCGSEAFGFDTLRIKENNIRVHFDDTSGSASFANRDWRIEINGSENGDPEYFSIDDVTAGTKPFRVDGTAPTDSLRIDSDGDLGIGTGVPAVNLHVVEGNTPTLRLEQDGSAGFAPQTWDLAGNESGFFIRDLSNASALSFRIQPGAPNNGIVIDGDGDLSIGAGTSADAPVHVTRNNSTSEFMRLESTASGVQDRPMMFLSNNGGIRFEFNNAELDTAWRFQAATANQDQFEVTKVGTGQIEMALDNAGNLEIKGALTQSSDRNAKHSIERVDEGDLLERLASLDISEWTYKADEDGVRHLGPMAQDFHAAFGLGASPTQIAPGDMAGVSMAALKAMNARQRNMAQKLQQKDERIVELEARLELLESLILQRERTAMASDSP